jgi:hypothetical protein
MKLAHGVGEVRYLLVSLVLLPASFPTLDDKYQSTKWQASGQASRQAGRRDAHCRHMLINPTEFELHQKRRASKRLS